jgi:hypothetical protein
MLNVRSEQQRNGKIIKQTGNAIIEFAIILPLILLLAAGVFDLGLSIYRTSELTNIANQVVRRVAASSLTCPAIDVDTEYDSTRSGENINRLLETKYQALSDRFQSFIERNQVEYRWRLSREWVRSRGFSFFLLGRFRMKARCYFCGIFKSAGEYEVEVETPLEHKGVCSNKFAAVPP